MGQSGETDSATEQPGERGSLNNETTASMPDLLLVILFDRSAFWLKRELRAAIPSAFVGGGGRMPANKKCGTEGCKAYKRRDCSCPLGTVGSLNEKPRNPKLATKVAAALGAVPKASAKPAPVSEVAVKAERAEVAVAAPRVDYSGAPFVWKALPCMVKCYPGGDPVEPFECSGLAAAAKLEEEEVDGAEEALAAPAAPAAPATPAAPASPAAAAAPAAPAAPAALAAPAAPATPATPAAPGAPAAPAKKKRKAAELVAAPIAGRLRSQGRAAVAELVHGSSRRSRVDPAAKEATIKVLLECQRKRGPSWKPNAEWFRAMRSALIKKGLLTEGHCADVCKNVVVNYFKGERGADVAKPLAKRKRDE